MRQRRLAYPYLLWTAIFVVVPLLLVAFFAFTEKNAAGHYVFTLEGFRRLLGSNDYLLVFWRSFELSVISTLICLVLGYPVALILAGRDFAGKRYLITLIILPMWMNFLLRTYAWMTLLENTGLINTLLRFFGLPPFEFLYHNYSIVLGMVYNFLPFMILPIYSVLIKIDPSIIEAAEDLGASKTEVFRRVIFPLSLGGVASGITMVFMPALTTFAISALLGGGKIYLVGNLIENEFLVANNWNFGSVLSFVLMLCILVCTAVVTKFEQENEKGGKVLW